MEPPGSLATGQRSQDAKILSQEWGEKSKGKQKATTTVVTEEAEEEGAKKWSKKPDSNEATATVRVTLTNAKTVLPDRSSEEVAKSNQETPESRNAGKQKHRTT
jgi:hypothetical protein